MSPVEAREGGETVSSMAVGRTMEPEARGSATIGKAVKIVGQIYSREDLFVDGELEGTVETLENKVTIGPHGTVHAGVKAREVAVLGTIKGDVEAAEKIEIRKEDLVGNIKTARIIIEDGAYFKGSIDIVRPKSTAAPKAAPVASAPAPQPVHAAAEGAKQSGHT